MKEEKTSGQEENRRLREEVLELLEKLPGQKTKQKALLSGGVCFMDEGEIAVFPEATGENRYPYETDGLVLWARSSGYLEACEGAFTIFRPAYFGEDTPAAFWGGLKKEEGFFPVSITGAARAPEEPEDLARCLVFTPGAAYYLADCREAVFALRLYVDAKKRIRFSVLALNQSGERRTVYLASYLESLLRYAGSEGFWDKLTKFGEYHEGKGFLLKSRNEMEDLLLIHTHTEGHPTVHEATTSRNNFLGGVGRCLTNAACLRRGVLPRRMIRTTTPDLPCAAELYQFSLDAGESVQIDYSCEVRHQRPEEPVVFGTMDWDGAEKEIREREQQEKEALDHLQLRFGDWTDGRVDAAVLNRFIRCVQKQVSFCALGKNYAGSHIGVRDVFQQLESALLWQPEKSREKIVRALQYILSDGRPPRQFAVPDQEDSVPDLDLRLYVDQGCWVISTLYSYLSFTGDFSILEEQCRYWDLSEPEGTLKLSSKRDTLLEHLLSILDFLTSCLDETTGCLRALNGDWNDALDGLGKTRQPGKVFGDGVSVMASLQLYQNYGEMEQILEKTGRFAEKRIECAARREQLGKALLAFAVVEKDGQSRVIHGWGEGRRDLVGSFCDCDGEDRISLTANAFWAASGMIEQTPQLRDSVAEALQKLDSRYGLLTFDKAFRRESQAAVGRIATVTEGTYENKAAYVHGSMFGIMALFLLGESGFAWKQLEKSIVITHENATLTAFVMPNSYSDNPAYFLDGDSMGDWYTGSGTVLMKNLVRFGMGICPDLNGVHLCPPAQMPCSRAELQLCLKGKRITLRYQKEQKGKREIFAGEKVLATQWHPLRRTPVTYLREEELEDGMVILITD